MSFFNELRTASFKGISFALDSEDKEFGRDVKAQKIINGKRTYYEDVGVKENTFTIEAIVGGAEGFVSEIIAFENILQEKGEGRLILPHEGEMLAVVTNARRRTATNEVGIARFSITFARLDESVAVTSPATSVALRSISEKTTASTLSDFLNIYNDNVPDFVLNDTQEQILDFVNGIKNQILRIRNFDIPNFDVSDAATLANQVISMFEEIVDFNEEVDYTVSISSIVASESTPQSALDISRILNDASVPLLPAEISTTSSGSLRALNNAAVDLFTKIGSVAAAAKAVSYAEFSSKDEAINTRNNLLKNMAVLRQGAGRQKWSDSYKAIGSMMAAVNTDINTGLGRLPDTVTIRNQAVRSALELSYRLYGDNRSLVISKASDIVARNNIIHPSFVPADDLEVLIDA